MVSLVQDIKKKNFSQAKNRDFYCLLKMTSQYRTITVLNLKTSFDEWE